MMYRALLLGCILIGGTRVIAQDWTVALDSVMHLLAEEDFFNGQILIAEKGKVLFNEAYGDLHVDGESQTLTEDTALPVFSVGKSLTALSVMLLEAEGKLRYEDRVRKFIPELPYESVTIRHLLTMTSGLPRFLETALKHADTTTVMSNPGILDLVARHQPEAGAPGVNFQYNNANYILLAAIVESVSGLPFGTFLEERIFQPIGMRHTQETAPFLPDSLKGKPITADHFFRPYGTGTVATTATDLFLYDQALYNGQLLSQAQLHEGFKCMRLKDGTYSNYGFGWRIVNCDSLREVYHVGDGPGMRASFQRQLSDQQTLIYLHVGSNVYHQAVYEIVRAIRKGEPYVLPQKRLRYNIDTALYDKYTGSYLSNFGLIHISTSEGRLFLRPDAIPGKEELIPSSDTTFYFKGQNLSWEFFLNDEEEVVGFGIEGDRENMGIKQ